MELNGIAICWEEMFEFLRVLVEKVPFTLWILASLPIGFIYVSLLVPLSLLSFHAVVISLTGTMLPVFTFLERLDPVITSSIYRLDTLSLLIAWNYALLRACTKGWERIVAFLLMSYMFTLLNFFLVRRVTTKITSYVKHPRTVFIRELKESYYSFRRWIRTELMGLKEERCEREKEARIKEKLGKEIKLRMWLHRVVEARAVYEGEAFPLMTVTNLYVISVISFALVSLVFLILFLSVIWGRGEGAVLLSNFIILLLFLTSWRVLREWRIFLRTRLNKLEEILQECFIEDPERS